MFDDKDVKDRNLADWEGVWQSVYPYLLNGDLDPVFKKKAAKDKSKTFAEVKAYYRKGMLPMWIPSALKTASWSFIAATNPAPVSISTPGIRS